MAQLLTSLVLTAKSKPNKDFGMAFYLSDDEQQALEFLKRIQYIKGITFQYAFCTQRAIDKLIKQTSR